MATGKFALNDLVRYANPKAALLARVALVLALFCGASILGGASTNNDREGDSSHQIHLMSCQDTVSVTPAAFI